jgi:hypothetical protein
MIFKPETATRATPETKVARLEVEANLLNLPVDAAAERLDVSRSTVLRDRRELELKSLAGMSDETAAYWQLEMADIMADVQHLRRKAHTNGNDNLLLRTLDRWWKIIDANLIHKSVTATVNLSEPWWCAPFREHTYGLEDDQIREWLESARDIKRRPRVLDASYFPPATKELEP